MSSVPNVVQGMVAIVLTMAFAACSGATVPETQPSPLPSSSPAAVEAGDKALEPPATVQTALVTQVRGQATVTEESGSVHVVQPMQLLRHSARVQVPSGAHLGLICMD